MDALRVSAQYPRCDIATATGKQLCKGLDKVWTHRFWWPTALTLQTHHPWSAQNRDNYLYECECARAHM
eukprot:1140207-Pelagomonas_calceolata.AAC.1